MSLVLFQGIRINDNVIYVCDVVNVLAVAQCFVNVALKHRGGVGQAKGDYRVLEVPKAGPKGHLLLSAHLFTHAMIHIADIAFAVVPGTQAPIESLPMQG
jgi:hypothetical protein